jgi:hypothetical protein
VCSPASGKRRRSKREKNSQKEGMGVCCVELLGTNRKSWVAHSHRQIYSESIGELSDFRDEIAGVGHGLDVNISTFYSSN